MLTLEGESHLHATSAVTSVTAAAVTAILTAAGAYTCSCCKYTLLCRALLKCYATRVVLLVHICSNRSLAGAQSDLK
jgi:hypothetical protein